MIDVIQMALGGGSGAACALITVYFMSKRNAERVDDAHKRLDTIETDRKACGAKHDGSINSVYSRINDDNKNIMATLTQIQVSVARMEGKNTLAQDIAQGITEAIRDYTKTQRIKMES